MSTPVLKTEKIAADGWHLNGPLKSLFSLISSSELSEMIDASITSEGVSDR